jgi:uncharacterized protein (DUF1800 family)
LAATAAGCAPVAQRFAERAEALPAPVGATPELRLLERAGYGPRPGDLARAHEIGRHALTERLLAADEGESARLNLLLSRIDALHMDSFELMDIPKERVLEGMRAAALLRATYGTNPLQERMTEFWADHLNVYARKDDAAFRLSADLEGVARKHALGSFPAMIRASMGSPAMVAYLDNDRNEKAHPNENYARELLELHTLGVDGGYSQRDVMEVARCLSGWTIEKRFLRPKGRIRFDETQHDDGEKRVLGHTIPAGGGAQDLEAVWAIVCDHPATAHHIARKLVKRFVGDAPALQARVEKAFAASRGDVRATIRPILESREIADGPPLLRRPFDLVVAALRATDSDTDGGPALQDHLRTMGQPSYEWPMPDGYPVRTESWASAMLPRWNFAYALATDAIAGTSIRHKDPRAVRPGTESDMTAWLASPEFQWM